MHRGDLARGQCRFARVAGVHQQRQAGQRQFAERERKDDPDAVQQAADGERARAAAQQGAGACDLARRRRAVAGERPFALHGVEAAEGGR